MINPPNVASGLVPDVICAKTPGTKPGATFSPTNANISSSVSQGLSAPAWLTHFPSGSAYPAIEAFDETLGIFENHSYNGIFSKGNHHPTVEEGEAWPKRK